MSSFEKFWNEILKLSHLSSDIAPWWDEIAKSQIKKFCIAYSVERKKCHHETKEFTLASLKFFLAKKQ